MTDERMALAELLEKGSDRDLLREMIGFVAQRLMDVDVDGLVGAGHGERAEGRENWRNGYRDREWHTRSGTIPLRIPKLRRVARSPARAGAQDRVRCALKARPGSAPDFRCP